MAGDSSTFKLLFQTTADTAGAEKVQQSLKATTDEAIESQKRIAAFQKSLDRGAPGKQQQRGAGTESVLSSFQANAEEQLRVFGTIGSGAGKAATAVEGLGGSFGGLATKMGGIAIAAKLAADAVGLVGESLDAFGQKEAAVTRLDAALANNGQLTDEYREKLQGMADTLETTTGVADDKWLAVLTRLTQFGADSTNIDQYTAAVKNLAGIMGGDVEGAANMVSRAMAGSFEMFGRYGIHVDDTATKAEQLSQVLAQLGQRGGGQLEAAAHTLEGSAARAANAWDGLKTNIGGVFADGAKSWNNTKTGFFNFVANLLPSAIKQAAGLKNNVDAVGDSTGLADAEADAKELETALADAKERADSLARGLDATARAWDKNLAAMKRVQDHLDKVAGEKAKGDAAKIDNAQTRGAITPEQALVAKENVRARAEAEKFQRAQSFNATQQGDYESQATRLRQEGERGVPGADQKLAEVKEKIALLKEEAKNEKELYDIQQQNARREAVTGILDARKNKQEAKPEKVGKPSKADSARADALADARGIARDAGETRGPSPEATARLQKAASALNDGATGGELEALNGVLEKLATGLEKKGKDAADLRAMQAAIKKLEAAVTRLGNEQ